MTGDRIPLTTRTLSCTQFASSAALFAVAVVVASSCITRADGPKTPELPFEEETVELRPSVSLSERTECEGELPEREVCQECFCVEYQGDWYPYCYNECCAADGQFLDADESIVVDGERGWCACHCLDVPADFDEIALPSSATYACEPCPPDEWSCDLDAYDEATHALWRGVPAEIAEDGDYACHCGCDGVDPDCTRDLPGAQFVVETDDAGVPVEADGGGAIAVLDDRLLCDVVKDGCVPLPDDMTRCVPEGVDPCEVYGNCTPTTWTCDDDAFAEESKAFMTDGLVVDADCDCGCGVPDPDCDDDENWWWVGFVRQNCDTAPGGCVLDPNAPEDCIADDVDPCTVYGTCTPTAWTCPEEDYAESLKSEMVLGPIINNRCHCGCGVHDPDCGWPGSDPSVCDVVADGCWLDDEDRALCATDYKYLVCVYIVHECATDEYDSVEDCEQALDDGCADPIDHSDCLINECDADQCSASSFCAENCWSEHCTG